MVTIPLYMQKLQEHAWQPGPAHTQGMSRPQLVYRVQVSPTFVPNSTLTDS